MRVTSDLTDWTACEPPRSVTVTGRWLTVRPYETDSDLQPLWQALGGASGINDRLRYFPNPDFGDSAAFGAWLRAKQGEWRTFVFEAVDTAAIVGMASYMRIDPENGSIEVGSVAHGPAMARRRGATEAHYLMARYVFEDLGYRRYEWKCHNDNEASKRAAERLGFTFEGVFRQHMVAKGKNRDTAWYSIIDREWPQVRHAMEAWLSSDNFDDEGRQIARLETLRGAGDWKRSDRQEANL